ncbi:hypothetical protein SGRA_1959 [Saprospira grandis str. Lewin]|uniref:Uncharacterized protein n=1 Tax=Saprospira grandis (strain Lewin) TaxID=984262 RepID=H6L252_SAPGL|nr:hypothetical protein SGRA_1959 [Saprospira grandis str. Lewin]
MFLGLPTRFARVGLFRSSQVCSALRRLRRLGLALRATAVHPSARFNRAALTIFAMNFWLGQLFFKGIAFAMAEKNRAD